jgi:hypothetical protein
MNRLSKNEQITVILDAINDDESQWSVTFMLWDCEISVSFQCLIVLSKFYPSFLTGKYAKAVSATTRTTNCTAQVYFSSTDISISSCRQGDVDTWILHFVHSLKTFCQLKEVKEVVVVCDPDYSDVFEGCKVVHAHSIFTDLAVHLSKVFKNRYLLLQVLLRTCKYLLNLHDQEERDRTLFLMDFRSVITH